MNVAASGFLPVLALLYAASFWGFVWFPARELEAMGMAGLWQMLISYSSALLVLGVARGVDLRSQGSRWSDVVWLVLAAGWTNVAFVLAVLQDEVVRVLILFYLSPLWTVLLGRWLLGEPIRLLTGWMLGLGLLGAVVMLWHDDVLNSPPGMGDYLAMSAGFSFAVTNVMTRRLTQLSTVQKTQLSWLGVVLVSLVWIALIGEAMPALAFAPWMGAVALGLLGFMFATLSVVYAVSRMPVQRSSVIMLFEVVVGAVTAWWLANEAIDLQEWLGGSMIILAGLVAVFAKREELAE